MTGRGVTMITVNGIRNALWSVVAFGIVAIASTPLPFDKLTTARNSVALSLAAQGEQVMPGRPAAGST